MHLSYLKVEMPTRCYTHTSKHLMCPSCKPMVHAMQSIAYHCSKLQWPTLHPKYKHPQTQGNVNAAMLPMHQDVHLT